MTSNPILDLFGTSPMRPMQDHMDKVDECAEQLSAFFEAVFARDWTKVEQLQRKIAELENQADDLKKDIRMHLPKGLFLPVARTDLLALLSAQDKIANKAKDIAGLMTGRRMQIPEMMQDNFRQYIARCLDATKQARSAITELDELVTAGFRGREAGLVENMINELDDIENETDSMQIAIRRQVFSLEAELPPVDVVFLYKIIEWLGDLANRAQSVGSRLELMLAR